MRRNKLKSSEMERKIETDRGVGSCRCRKKLKDVDRSGQKGTEPDRNGQKGTEPDRNGQKRT